MRTETFILAKKSVIVVRIRFIRVKRVVRGIQSYAVNSVLVASVVRGSGNNLINDGSSFQSMMGVNLLIHIVTKNSRL